MCHVIDSHSPFYNLSARDFVEKRFELLVTLSGASRSTGQCTEERTSYLSKEILWGHRFVNMIHYDAENRVHAIEYDSFDSTEQVRLERNVDSTTDNCNCLCVLLDFRSIHRCAVLNV